MALTYEQSAELMNDPIFRNRIKVACLVYARYISEEAATVPAHSTRIRWAQQTLVASNSTVEQVAPTVVMDPAVQQDGATITDTALQGATENAVNKLL